MAPDSSDAAGVKHHTTDTKKTKVAAMHENEIAKQIFDAARVAHTKLGPEVFEPLYEVVLAHELRKKSWMTLKLPTFLCEPL